MTPESMVAVAADALVRLSDQVNGSVHDAEVCAQIVISAALREQVNVNGLASILARTFDSQPPNRYASPNCRSSAALVTAFVLTEDELGRWRPQSRFAPACEHCGKPLTPVGTALLSCKANHCGVWPRTEPGPAYVPPADRGEPKKWSAVFPLFADRPAEFDGFGPTPARVVEELSCHWEIAHAVVDGNIEMGLVEATAAQLLRIAAPFPAGLWADLGDVGRAPWLRRALLVLDAAGVDVMRDRNFDVDPSEWGQDDA